MTIKEVEEATGLSRSHIRFYEKEKLFCPSRDGRNGYRDYSEEDVRAIQKIAFLRTLGIPVDGIRKVIGHEKELGQVLEEQVRSLNAQEEALKRAKELCARMIKNEENDFESFEVKRYIGKLPEYWEENRRVFAADAAGFFCLWGGAVVWGLLVMASLLTAVLSYKGLPERIPVQWSGETASSLADRGWIFAYPAACVLVRFLLRPFLLQWLERRTVFRKSMADYITNYLCFVALSAEVFTLLFTKGIVRWVGVLLVADGAVLALLVFCGYRALYGRRP